MAIHKFPNTITVFCLVVNSGVVFFNKLLLVSSFASDIPLSMSNEFYMMIRHAADVMLRSKNNCKKKKRNE